MGIKLIIVAALVATLSYHTYKCLTDVPETPTLEEPWWGPALKPSEKEDTAIRPFKIAVPDEVLNDLNRRLSTHRPLTPSLEGIAQEYGMNDKLLTSIVEFWKSKYNWREREKFLNQYPQFKVSVQGLKIHYLHVKPTKTDGLKVYPLLLLHGWPGSVREFYEIIPFLTQPQKGRNFVFEVIAPSLPGYGFSDPAVRPGLGPAQMAAVFKNLMTERLGFNKFYIQGGDWGALIVQMMSVLFPEKIIAVHSNMCNVNTPLSNLKLILGAYFPSLVIEKEHEQKVYPLTEKLLSFLILESGYMHLQATKPDTIGAVLNESPVGLAAYIIEKFTTWTNPAWKSRVDGALTEKFTLTNLLDNVMIYWVTNSITTSVRLYSEAFSKQNYGLGLDRIPVKIPSGCALLTHELMFTPESILRLHYHDLVHVSYHDGGHFAAFEIPKALANDIYDFIEKVNKK